MKVSTVRKGLTPLTAALLTILITSLAILASWHTLANASYNHHAVASYITTHKLPKIESIALGKSPNEVILNIRVGGYDEPGYVGVYSVKGNSLRNLPVTTVMTERIDNLLLVKVGLDDSVGEGEYLVKILVGGKNVEARFKL